MQLVIDNIEAIGTNNDLQLRFMKFTGPDNQSFSGYHRALVESADKPRLVQLLEQEKADKVEMIYWG